jgi:hypothetical protein
VEGDLGVADTRDVDDAARLLCQHVLRLGLHRQRYLRRERGDTLKQSSLIATPAHGEALQQRATHADRSRRLAGLPRSPSASLALSTGPRLLNSRPADGDGRPPQVQGLAGRGVARRESLQRGGTARQQIE